MLRFLPFSLLLCACPPSEKAPGDTGLADTDTGPADTDTAAEPTDDDLDGYDSLTDCGSKKDRHAHIGQGLIGNDAFKNIVAFAKKNNIDMILETEHEKVMDDIKLLKSFRE